MVYSWDTSGPNICDGEALLVDSTSIVDVNSIVWYGAGAVLQQGGTSITGLCPGTYTVTYTVGGNTVTETFTIGWGATDPCLGLYVTVDATSTSGGFLCDGTVTANAFGGAAPYSYSWDNGINGNPLTGMCEGVYYVTVTDANGCTTTNGVYVPNAGDSTLVIDNTGYDSTIVIDGSAGDTWWEDCIVDFTTIDSAYAAGANYNGVDSLFVNWVFVDSNGVIVSQYTVGYPFIDSTGNGGYYTVSITIYCPQHSMNITNIMATDVVYVAQAGINEEIETEFNVVNPFNEELLINFESSEDRVITLVDMSGKVILQLNDSSESVKLETSFVQSGMYLLNVNDSNGVSTKRLIKN
jgi:hypothetical protein